MKSLFRLPLFVLLVFTTISFFSCKSPTSKQQMFCSTLVINADTNCIVFVDGDSHGIFRSGDAKKVNLCKGEHLVIAKTTDTARILAKHIVVIGDSASKVVDLQIAQKIQISDIVATKPQTEENVKKDTVKVEEEVPLNPVVGSYQDPRDGKVYKTVRIGSQTWMAENLAYKSDNGCWAYENNEGNAAKYGYLYNWETAKSVCPPGWRLPSDADWAKLINYLGGFQVAGGKLKAMSLWSSPNTGASNASGFSAYPGGYRITSKDGFFLMGAYGLWWTSTSIGESTAYYLHVLCDNPYAFKSNGKKEDGLSVRCVRN